MTHIPVEARRPIVSPLFVVGASRSGTAMLRSCLNSHNQVYLVSETHYFDDLRARKGIRGIGELCPERVIECIDYFRALSDRPYGMKGSADRSPISREQLASAAALHGTDADAIFEAYCREIARENNASVWGEKTPRHVFHIDAIRDRFPEARFICMVRDPRAVVASYRDWKNQGGLTRAENDEDYQDAIRAEEHRAKLSYNIIIATMLWKAAATASIKAREKHGEEFVRIVGYEDVVANPEESLRAICRWLRIDYEPTVLEIPMHNSSFTQYSTGAGVSKIAAERWKKTLSTREIDIIQRVAGASLEAAGYSRFKTDHPASAMISEYLKLPNAVARAVLANRGRMGNVFTYTWLRLRAAFGL